MSTTHLRASDLTSSTAGSNATTRAEAYAVHFDIYGTLHFGAATVARDTPHPLEAGVRPVADVTLRPRRACAD